MIKMTNKLTSKELIRIRRAAFNEFRCHYSAEEWTALFAGDVKTIHCYEISDLERNPMTERWLVQYKTQINNSTLQDAGFSSNAAVKKLFTVNRQLHLLY